ncbi:HlyD family type I secretion periplasmic adaptor subunit [Psychromonas sp. Urea-02u-13]|uniref:HlyD family type I secretion periplasmic adaptor subunit n=1 Tax=Psychromonas sp. Urea-02u-13 TaxID=2058326 RepID=UPI000C3427C2|nr:HlyD family type I secretion periplasmic adaptor subunit [Psychromonas sp. Urea-02u-13]PKG37408.1 HlyD family type I secretion periplasmic adaptor subunit [Psychromonas sp. Urea-02u-13]
MKHIKAIVNALKNQKNEMNEIKRQRDEYEFLPAHLDVLEKPPAPKARLVAIVLTLFLIIILIWSIVGRLDIHAGAQGKLMVSSHSKIIQPLGQGEVTAINVKDGQRVKKGDSLIELNTVDIKAEIQRLSLQILHFNLEAARLSALLSDKPLTSFTAPTQASTFQIKKSKAHLNSEVEETDALVEQLQAELSVNLSQQQANHHDATSLRKLKGNIHERLVARQTLASSNSIAKVELLEQEKELLEVNRSINSLIAQQAVLKAQHNSTNEQIDSLLAQKRREYYAALNQVEINLSQVQQELIKAQENLRRQTLRSPVNGIVQQLSIHTLGGVVTPAQALMVVVPGNAILEAQVNVLNKDIGFVLAGQAVEIKIDSFPFTKYGTITGEVLHISQDAVQDEQLGFVFPARIRLHRSDILVEDSLIALSAGMSVMAEITTGDRRVIEYLLSPLQQYQSEAMRER